MRRTEKLVRRLGLVLAGTAAVLAGCAREPGPTIIARVGRHNIEIASFQGYVETVVGEDWKGVDDRVASSLLDQYLDQEVLAAAARRQRRFAIPVEPARRAAMIRSLVPEVCGAAPTPSPEEIRKAVEASLAQGRPDRVHVRQIIVGSEAEARKVRARLLAGEPFAKLSAELSVAPNAARGGELGVIGRGTLPEELEKVIFGLKAGEVSRPVKGPSGYHLFQVLEVYPGGSRKKSSVEATVRQELREDASRRWLSSCVQRLAARIGVRVLTDRLWFRYHGRYAEANDAATDRMDGVGGDGGPGDRAGGPAPGGGSHHGAGQ
jgi:hypothetical protein